MSIEKTRMRDTAVANVIRRPVVNDGARWGGVFRIECYDPAGNLKWSDEAPNRVVNVGLDHALDVTLSGGTQITSWFVGLTAASPTIAAADTMSSHAGWTEFTSYDESTREAFVDGGVSSQSLSNTASKAEFTISANGSSIGGAFLTSNSTKGGTTGTLYAAVAFSGGNKSADDNDVLQVTYTFTAADDGV
jgi:hypothetical protein